MRAACLLLLGALAGCAAPPVSGTARDPRRLVGNWRLLLTRDAHMPWPRRDSIAGDVALVANRGAARRYPRIGVPSHVGTTNVPLRAWGLEISSDEFPALVVGCVGADTVEVELRGNRGALTLVGVLRTDTIAGTWHTDIGRSGAMTGTFRMVRCATC